MMKSQAKAWVVLCAALALSPAVAAKQQKEVREFVAQNRKPIVEEFLKLVSQPSTENNVSQLQKTADIVEAMAKKRGMTVEQWPTSNGVPIVFAEKKVPGAKKTILLYAHYDGQPYNASEWSQPDPSVPVIRTDSIERGGKVVSDTKAGNYPDDWRIYARAAADDKVSVQAILSALDAIGSNPKHNIKVYFDGQEEAGGPGIAEAVAKYPDRLAADVMVLFDGPQHASGRPTIFYGTRGEAGVQVTVYTGLRGLHSGNYGNFLPDANVRMSQLIASMVDPTGKVAIKDFYADLKPFTAGEKAMFAAVPDVSKKMSKELGIGGPDGAASSLQEGLNLPSFSVHTLQGGDVGNVIPAKSNARLAMRLVAENDRSTMQKRVFDHIAGQGYFIVDKDPDVATLGAHAKIAKVVNKEMPNWLGSDPWRTDPDSTQAVAVTSALRSVWGDDLVRIRTLGGTLPAAGFIKGLKIPVVGVSIANYDNNQHSADENIRIGNLLDGIVTISSIMTN